MKNLVTRVLAGATALAAPVVAFAQESTVTAGTVNMETQYIDTTTLRSNLLNTIQPWITLGLGVGFTIFAVWLGYRLIRRFIR